MKSFLISLIIVIFASSACLFGAEAAGNQRQNQIRLIEPMKTPAGLLDSDWSSIRDSYEGKRHAIATNQNGTFQARNPRQAWQTRFDGRGFTVTPDSGSWQWGLELMEFGGKMIPAEPKHQKILPELGKISYVWDENITEWFVNDTRGLEQGWTVSRRPGDGGRSGPISLCLSVRGSLRPQIAVDDSCMVFLDANGHATVKYGGLRAWDSDGKSLPARFRMVDGKSSLFFVDVADTGARFPIFIDPIAQQTYLKASNSETGDRFGISVAVFGNTVVVGADSEDSGATGVNGNQSDNSVPDSGAAYVFVRTGDGWTQQAYLKASNPGMSDNFGNTVKISDDTIVVGAIYEDSGATGVNGNAQNNSTPDSGSAYVFVRNGNSWTQEAYLKASNTGADDRFGISVSISGDTIVVGAIWEDSSATGLNGNQIDNSASNSGAAYVFLRSGTTWSQQAYLKGTNTGTGDRFGWAVEISQNTIVVGAKWEDSAATGTQGIQADNSAPDSGAAYIFVRSGSVWGQQAYLKASNTEAGDNFGYSASISGDTVVVGSFFEDGGSSGINGNQTDNSATDSGAVYVFARNGSIWTQQAYLKTSHNKPYCRFGQAISISGETLVAGAYDESSSATGVNGNQVDNSAPYSGAAYVFRRTGSNWTQTAYLKASNTGGSDYFGFSVGVSEETVIVGALYEDSGSVGIGGNQLDNGAGDSGAAYIFFNSGPYSLHATASNGSIAGGVGDYSAGSIVNISAIPNPGYVFDRWHGGASGAANPLAVLMDSNKLIVAEFAPDIADPDNDGLSTYLEIVVYGTDPALSDTDEDGFSDSFEIATGFNPLLATSTPDALSSIRTAVEFRFNAADGVSYRIEASLDLSIWSTIEPAIIGQGGIVTRFYSTENLDTRYFRVRRN